MTRSDELNFLPHGYLNRRGRRRTTVVATAISVIVLAASGSALYVAQRSLQQAEREHDPIARNFDIATRQVDTLRRQRQQQRSLVQRAGMFASLVDGIRPGNVLAELTNALPSGASLLEMKMDSRDRQDATAANVTAFDQKKAELESKRRAESGAANLPPQEWVVKITGLAETDIQVAKFLEALHRSPLFRDVALVVSEAHAAPGRPGTALRKFQIQLTVNPAVRRDRQVSGQTAATTVEP